MQSNTAATRPGLFLKERPRIRSLVPSRAAAVLSTNTASPDSSASSASFEVQSNRFASLAGRVRGGADGIRSIQLVAGATIYIVAGATAELEIDMRSRKA